MTTRLLATITCVALLLAAQPATTTAEETASSDVLITRSYDDVSLRTVLADIAKAAKTNIIVQPEVEGRISVKLEGVPVRTALEQVVRVAGFTLDEQDGSLRVRTKTEDEVGTDYHRFAHWRPEGPTADADGNPVFPPIMRVLLHVVKPDGGTVRYIPSQNTALFTGSPATLQRVKALLAAFDAAPTPLGAATPRAAPSTTSPDARTIARFETLLQGARTEAAAKYFIGRLKELRTPRRPGNR